MTTISDLHRRLLRDTFGSRLNDSDAFLIFVLFHSHRIMLAAPILSDRPNVQVVDALTQRSVSDSLASLWAGTQDERADPTYWYFRWNGDWGSYRRAEKLTLEEQQRLEQLRTALEQHPFVSRLEPED